MKISLGRGTRGEGVNRRVFTEDDVFDVHEKVKCTSNRYCVGGRKGHEGIYTAVDSPDVKAIDTAKAEVFDKELSAQEVNRLLQEKHIVGTETHTLDKVLDLTDESVLERIGVEAGEITKKVSEDVPKKEAYELTQQIGNIARNAGFDGILFVSSQIDDGHALVIFK